MVSLIESGRDFKTQLDLGLGEKLHQVAGLPLIALKLHENVVKTF